jgi:hypothetical protein
LAKHKDKSYVFEPICYAASPLQLTALTNNDLDIAALGYSSFPLAVQNAGLTDLRILADEIQGRRSCSIHAAVSARSRCRSGPRASRSSTRTAPRSSICWR